MAYCNKLPENKFNAVYDLLMDRAEKSLISNGQQYIKGLNIKGTGRIRSTSGFYPNPWCKVLNMWTRNKITNLEVYDMLKVDYISEMVRLTPYNETLK